ncbi:hypothetical protein OIV83_004518 [Microbotryomycetes sp. JL201]|nr:hypothetical protein OIV83_004518 [Microbotryomycetes sp. JL201]
MKFTAAAIALGATAALAQQSGSMSGGMSGGSMAPSASASGGMGGGMSGGNGTDYAATLIAALSANNLTTLLGIAQQNAQTLLPLLQMGGNKTVFAPTDAAFAQLPENVTSNAQLVANTVLYHVYFGSYGVSQLSEMPTIARSALNATDLVNLPGGQGQVAVLTRGSGNSSNVVVNQLTSNVTSVATAPVANLIVHVIPQVLMVPGTLTETLSMANLTALTGALTSAAPEAVPMLEEARGITVFAPNDQAFGNVQSLIGQLNQTAIANVLLNHVINGTVVYSTQIENGSEQVSAGGQPLRFMTNSTGAFVMSGNSTARIVRANVPFANGVAHVIDGVLANPASNPQAAASAASSAASAAQTATAAATGPVGGGTMTATGSAPSGSASQPASGSTKVVAGGFLGAGIAAGLALLA